MNGAQYLAETLSRHGVETLFGYPGGAIMPLYDALLDAPLRHILTRHEQAAAFAANGYARATGKLCVCLATSGPGATNLLTGVADALADSVPLLVITGQVAGGLIGTDAFQEVDVLGLSLGVTKHSYLVRDAAELADALPEAIRLARSGRPGPVWIDVPKDVLLADMGEHTPPAAPLSLDAAPAPEPRAVARARELLAAAERPLVYAGGGVVLAGAVDALRRFCARTDIPLIATLKGLGALPADAPLNLGMLGMHGAPGANRAVQACDLLLVAGARFDDRATGLLAQFAPQAKVIHLDADPAEIGKLRTADVALCGAMAPTLDALGAARPAIDAWRRRCVQWRETGGHALPPPGAGIAPQRLLRALAEAADEHTVIACDVGQHQMWVAQHYGFRTPRQHLTSGGLGAMGFGLPAAIGAQLAAPQARVINVSGDGSFLMNVQELATLKRYDLPVKVLLFDNQYLGMVRQQQALFYAGRYHCVDLSDNPDFVEVAHAFGIPALRAQRADEIDAVVEALLDTPGPLLVHVPIAREDNVWPVVAPGRANHDMIEEIQA
ncbi:acetolactate synthase 2 catalytic subunit [Acidihalobacter ferrooxydans]|nr:acetolactate synthase 2 catalytic subunit [Acidihalobacter ferrooxydans]